MWATGMATFDAAMAPARVELVSLDKEPVWPFLEQQVFDALEHRAGLIGVRARPYAQIHVGRGDLESVVKGTGHFVVAVLPGIQESPCAAPAASG
jgi:hypothetical protein